MVDLLRGAIDKAGIREIRNCTHKAPVVVSLTVHGDKVDYRGLQRLRTNELLSVLRTRKPTIMRTLKTG